MYRSVAGYLRRLAGMIEEDDTPQQPIKGTKKHDTQVREHKEPIKPTVRPQKNRPSLLKHQQDPNRATADMAEYMETYRAEGRDMETNSPNSKYVKKLKK